jgi:hypothetical protein
LIHARAEWVVDTSGRGKYLARRTGLARQNPIRHGTAFMWVDGLVDIDKLTKLSPRQNRLKPQRRATGHLPVWLATNHFMGEGFWFWVIPLQGKTSLGLVYDNRLIPHERVWTKERLLDWVCEEFPLFEADLRKRTILDYSTIKDFSYDCAQTISEHRWALSGEAGRFTDPLYSPGSDLISMHNTLIVDAILTDDPAERVTKAHLYEQLMEAFYGATVPSYAVTYDCLGDQEAFAMKYSWELSVYFSFYVFPFVNELFTDTRFVPGFLNRFARLGPVNRRLQEFISGFYRWKIEHELPAAQPLCFDFTDFDPLRRAEKSFYEVGITVEEALDQLTRHLAHLDEMARWIVAFITSRVLNQPAALHNASFIESIDFRLLSFNVAGLERWYGRHIGNTRAHKWSMNAAVMDAFRSAARTAPAPAQEAVAS